MVDPRHPSLSFPPIPGVPASGTLLQTVHPTIIRRGINAITRRPPAARPAISASTIEWPATVTVTPRGAPSAAHSHPVIVLLLRMTDQSWGPLRPPSAHGAPVPGAPPVDVPVDDVPGIGVSGPLPAKIIEWRCAPPAGVDRHRWDDYETLAQAATNWIGQQAGALPGHILLLGSTMPPEVGVGIGMHLARAEALGWPDQLWPLVWSQQRNFVIPNLDLGWVSTHPDRTV
jgi:hypothetical protein